MPRSEFGASSLKFANIGRTPSAVGRYISVALYLTKIGFPEIVFKKNINMQKIKFLLLFLVSIFTSGLHAQTLGVTQAENNSLQGYTFFSPFSGTKAYLIDNCGYLINKWNRGTRPGLSAYFLENGLMLRTYKPPLQGPFTSASNAGGLELVDWDNNTVWSYEFNTPTWLSHHDAVYMPNGHILVLTWDLVYSEELIELGRNPDEIAAEGYMWSERIIEIETIGNDDMNIVWQWQIKDHYIQDFDAGKLNFGTVAEHPELFNINLPKLNSNDSNSTRDWNHFNSIDYNEALDQILISVRNSDEIWILDHSTSTEEAASHSGGQYGKGGDILYRWGNAAAYDRASVSGQKLFGQHGVNWIKNGLADAGKILIYNNGNGRPGQDFSRAEILAPPQNADGGYIINGAEPYGPEEAEWTYGDQPGEFFYSPYLSNAQRLPNGNMLINAGSPGIIFEIDSDRDIVWKYIIPLNGDSPYAQGQSPINNGNFRAYKFAADYPGLAGKDLTQQSTIELGNSPVNCEIISSSFEKNNNIGIEIKYDAINKTATLVNQNNHSFDLKLFDINGRLYLSKKINGKENKIDMSAFASGIYFFRVSARNGDFFTKKLFVFDSN
ncbi:MAG TPA: T9SS type A sorting domain-containing protein [Bacteroidetes bacterium]|nr:T9SS type A sorting domain-containing protein [Bacteroidota bacterium]